jgi:hypothetical protein
MYIISVLQRRHGSHPSAENLHVYMTAFPRESNSISQGGCPKLSSKARGIPIFGSTGRIKDAAACPTMRWIALRPHCPWRYSVDAESKPVSTLLSFDLALRRHLSTIERAAGCRAKSRVRSQLRGVFVLSKHLRRSKVRSPSLMLPVFGGRVLAEAGEAQER